MKVLYVTRKYPPSVGGMEKAAYELHYALKDIADVKLIAYGGPNKYIPVVYPWLFFRALAKTYTWRPDVVYLQDGVMAPMGFMLRLLTRKPIVMSVHGLEVTFSNKLYQAVMKHLIPRVQRIVVGSQQTEEAVRTRYPQAPISKVTYGIRDTFYLDETTQHLRSELESELKLTSGALAGRKLLLTTGRLVQRKGVAWFVESVLPKLVVQHPEVLYLIAGKGPDEEKIRLLIEQHNLSESTMQLGYISDRARDLLYNTVDFFVMPNIPVPNDMEGFGLVAVEASSCGTSVIASGIEGITDAVIEGKTGYKLPAKNGDKYIATLSSELQNPSLQRAAVRTLTLENYSWQKAAQGYLEIFQAEASQ